MVGFFIGFGIRFQSSGVTGYIYCHARNERSELSKASSNYFYIYVTFWQQKVTKNCWDDCFSYF